MNPAPVGGPGREPAWPATMAWLFAAIVVAGLGYFVWRAPLQVADLVDPVERVRDLSYRELPAAHLDPVGGFRPGNWVLVKVAADLGHRHEAAVWRGLLLAQVAAIVAVFVALLRVRTVVDLVAALLAVLVLVGERAFHGAVVEAYPLNHFGLITLCTLAVVRLLMAPPSVGRDLAVAGVSLVAVLTLESGVVVAVAAVGARLAGLRGASWRGVGMAVLIAMAFLVARQAAVGGEPLIGRHATGIGFERVEAADLLARYGERPLALYAYNVGAAALEVLASEPRDGRWDAIAAALGEGLSPRQALEVGTSVGALLLLAWYLVRGRPRERDEAGQLVVVALILIAGNAAIALAYVKSAMLGPASALLAVAVFAAARALLGRAVAPGPPWRPVVAGVAMCALMAGWTLRAADLGCQLRDEAFTKGNDWASALEFLDGGLEPRHAQARALLRRQFVALDVPSPGVASELAPCWLGRP
ncbi:MAG: hypothetical protein AB7O67_04170 [Vicinamibacterales bacterium]